ncbi:MAG: hypothetical protein ACK5XC_12100, partial [Pseudanabaena sp.]
YFQRQRCWKYQNPFVESTPVACFQQTECYNENCWVQIGLAAKVPTAIAARLIAKRYKQKVGAKDEITL